MGGAPVKWEKLTSAEIDAIDRGVPVLLNVAAIEQHGPHLPLDTDAAIGRHFTDQLDARDPEAQLILPQIKVCCSAHHMDYPGTLSVGHRVLLDYASGVLDSARRAGFSIFLVLNSHGGNQAIAQVLLEEFGAMHTDCTVALATWWTLAREELARISESGPQGTGHACELETSLMMHADAVPADLELPAGERYVSLFDWNDGSMLHGAKAAVYRSMREISGGSGVVGQPDAASAAKGERISAAVTDALARVVEDLRRSGAA